MITLALDRTLKTTLAQQLYAGIRGRIVSGELKSGDRLPSKRALAAHLKISVVTVEAAYGQLTEEGYLCPKAGSGFYVETFLPSPKKPADTPKFARLPQKNRYPYDFSTSGADIDAFPFSVWQKLSREVLSGKAEELLTPCPSAGTPELRRAISDYLRDFRGMQTDPRQIVVGAGSEYLMNLAIQLLGREKIYGIENPGYPKIAGILHACGARALPLPMDENGLLPPAKDACPEVLHLTPAHHFPLGITMPAGRRSELLFCAEKAGAYLLEDDYDSEFRYRGQVIPTLYSMDGGNRVICIGTFTKLLAPSLRISYMVLPPALCALYEQRLSFYSCTVPVFEQRTLAVFLDGGYLERHVNRMKKIYKKRRDALLEALEPEIRKGTVRPEGDEAGLHLLLTLHTGISEKELVARAAENGVLVHGLSEYYYPGSAPENAFPCFVLGFAGIREENAEESVRALLRALPES